MSKEEHNTQLFIQQELDRIGISHRAMAGTGVCAEITGAAPGRTVLMRCDIDALPIDEATGLDYSSIHPGVMHACGHDAHTTIGLAILTVLKERQSEWTGTVKIMFQPTEEAQPGGAKPMIEEGILENPAVDAALCLHTNPFLTPGTFEMKPGYMLANTDRVYLTLTGKGGHAAAPQQGIDAIAMAGQFLSAAQSIVSRQISPLDHAVITFGTIQGGTASNVLCGQVDISGTVRTILPETQDKIEAQLERLLQTVTEFWGGTYAYTYSKGYPASWNDPALTTRLTHSLNSAFGETTVSVNEHPYMSGDDFSIVANEVPSVFMYWGTGSLEKENFPWHNANYHVNLDSLKYGAAAGLHCLLELLKEEGAERV
ncbi:M20 metallopeptidase family protein [Sporosarcina koreensis]|uniref:M20 metallopeptidase family protein n=1 Tax=Sporosarcina koreensis TaxID=334735 RepID=UPI0009E3578F|nr:M20 family metallopeptidase [Sporosarcina koreensis]